MYQLIPPCFHVPVQNPTKGFPQRASHKGLLPKGLIEKRRSFAKQLQLSMMDDLLMAALNMDDLFPWISEGGIRKAIFSRATRKQLSGNLAIKVCKQGIRDVRSMALGAFAGTRAATAWMVHRPSAGPPLGRYNSTQWPLFWDGFRTPQKD